MFRKGLMAVFGVCLVISLAGCNLFKNPVGPDGNGGEPPPEPTPRVVTIVSGENSQPVANASVITVSEGNKTTDKEGKVIFYGENGKIAIEASGFLRRELALYNLVKDEIDLWPDRPEFESQFTHELIYSRGSTFMTRPINNIIRINLSDELRQDKSAFEAHKRKADTLLDAYNGHIRPPVYPMRVELMGFDNTSSPAGAVFDVSVGSSYTFQFLYNGVGIFYGSMTYASMAEAKRADLFLRVLSLISGLSETHYPGVMHWRSPTTSDFTYAEKLAMRLSLLRHPGNRFPDSE